MGMALTLRGENRPTTIGRAVSVKAPIKSMSVSSSAVRQIILSPLALLAISHLAAAQPPATFTPPAQQYAPPNVAPINVDNQGYAQPAPGQQVPPGMPIYPPGTTVVPLPSQTPGSIFGPPAVPPGTPVPPGVGVPEQLPSPFGAGAVVVGPGGAVPMPVAGPANPISVPVADDDLAWDQIADVVSDYFTISREQRARRFGETTCEGRIDTAPQDGATWLQPERHDSVGSFNRWESTFQSIRRIATVRVIPDANGYLVEVIVEKQLEDLPKPEKSTAGAATFRFDGSLPSERIEQVSRARASQCWISLGRDPALEQRMLAEIHARLNGVTGSRVSLFKQQPKNRR